MTGRLGYVRPTSENPCVRNVRIVPVNNVEPLTGSASRASVSTGAPDSSRAVSLRVRDRRFEERRRGTD